MVDSAGLMMDGDDVNMENTLLSFAGYFASSLLTEKKISFTLPHGTNSHLQLHLQYDMGTYEAPATLEVRDSRLWRFLDASHNCAVLANRSPIANEVK